MNSVLCNFFLGKINKMLPKPRFSKPIFGHSTGSTKSDRPYGKQFRYKGVSQLHSHVSRYSVPLRITFLTLLQRSPFADLLRSRVSHVIRTLKREQRTKRLRGQAPTLFISRDTFNDSIAKYFCACLPGVLHKYCAICCKMGYRTEMSV